MQLASESSSVLSIIIHALQQSCFDVTGAGTNLKKGLNCDDQPNTLSGAQSQQALLQKALKRKGCSPTRRHTFNGSDTEFGDALETAPSIFKTQSRSIGAILLCSCSAVASHLTAFATSLWCVSVSAVPSHFCSPLKLFCIRANRSFATQTAKAFKVGAIYSQLMTQTSLRLTTSCLSAFSVAPLQLACVCTVVHAGDQYLMVLLARVPGASGHLVHCAASWAVLCKSHSFALAGGLHPQHSAHFTAELDPRRSKSVSANAAAIQQVRQGWLLHQQSLTPSSTPNSPLRDQAGPDQVASQHSTRVGVGVAPQHCAASQTGAGVVPSGSIAGRSAQINLPHNLEYLQGSGADLKRPSSAALQTADARNSPVIASEADSDMVCEAAVGASGPASESGESSVITGSRLAQATASVPAAAAATASLTPFSAFAQHSQRLPSWSSSGTVDSDSADQPGLERQRSSNSSIVRRSGSFGRRGAALGYMMAAQQQWRQDSFSQRAEQRSSVTHSRTSRSPKDSLTGQQYVAGDAGQQPDDKSGAKAQGAIAPVWKGRTAQPSSGAAAAAAGTGQVEAAKSVAVLEPGTSSSVGTAQTQSSLLPDPGSTNQQAGAEMPVAAVNPVLNPFLAAAQLWHQNKAGDNSDDSDSSNVSHGSSAQPSRLNSSVPPSRAADSAADSAAIAERWLAAQQELMDESDHAWGGSAAGPAAAQSRVANPGKAQAGRAFSGQDGSQTAVRSARRSRSVQAGPPPVKGVFPDSPPAVHPAGDYCTLHSTCPGLQPDHSWHLSQILHRPKPFAHLCCPALHL